ncbi:MAG: glycosyltransferase family 2 protein [Phycisphaerales bacterium]|jgi:dolichol-phosphate mannosyltransferase
MNKPNVESTEYECGVSVCIPCFNEAEGIAGTVEEIIAALDNLDAGAMAEIILVDDGSRDSTREIIDRMQAETPADGVKVVALGFDRNRGRGAAVRTAIQASRGKYVVCLDADLSYDVTHLARIIAKFEEMPSTDVVVVSPYMRGGTTSGVPWNRLFVSRVANWILAGFFEGKLRTVTCVVRGYRGDFVRSLPAQADGKGAHLEMLRLASVVGGNMVEIPGHLAWRAERRTAGRNWLPGSKITTAARQHVMYGILVRPARLLKYVAIVLALVAGWEFVVISQATLAAWGDQGEIFRDLWIGLSDSFSRSPHSFVILGLSSVLALQIALFLVVLKVLQLQQEETMRLLIGIHRALPKSERDACAG